MLQAYYRIYGNIGGYKIWRFTRNLAKMHCWPEFKFGVLLYTLRHCIDIIVCNVDEY